MLAFIEGRIESRANNTLVLDVGGVGFAVQTTSAAMAAPGPKLRVYTRMIVREDAIELFGFLHQEEVAMFDKLTSVSGVGPRLGLAILSSVTLNDLILAIAAGDEKALTRVPGIGKKTAQRLVLELKDKMEPEDLPSGAAQAVAPVAMGAQQEAIEALIALGYSSAEAARAINQVRDQSDATNQLILLALKQLDNG